MSTPTPKRLSAEERAEDCVRHSRRVNVSAVELKQVIAAQIREAEEEAVGLGHLHYQDQWYSEGFRAGAEKMREAAARALPSPEFMDSTRARIRSLPLEESAE